MSSLSSSHQNCNHDCDHVFVTDEMGFEICNKCGLVKDDRPIISSYEIAYTKDEIEKRSHHGTPLYYLGPSLVESSYINTRNVTNKRLLSALRSNTRLSWREKNLKFAKIELNRIRFVLGIPLYVAESAMITYIKIFKAGLLKGRSMMIMIGASLLYNVKKFNLSISIKDISDATGVPIKKIQKGYLALLKHLSLKPTTINPKYVMTRYFNELNIDLKYMKVTLQLIDYYSKRVGTSGKNMRGIIAAVLYFIAKKYKLKLSQRTIAKLLNVTEVTLRTRKKELEKIYLKFEKKMEIKGKV